MTLKRLPVEGALLKELRVFGNGKDCCIRMQTTDPNCAVHFEMQDPTFQIDLQGRVQTVIFNDRSDTQLGVRYLPKERLRVRSFVVDYPGSHAAWRKVLKGIRDGLADPFDWVLESVQLTIAPEEASESQSGDEELPSPPPTKRE